MPEVMSAPPQKRKRPEGEDAGAESSSTPGILSGSQLSQSLRATSFDILKQTLTCLRQATNLLADEDVVSPNDPRLVLARDFLEARGADRLFEAWTRLHDTSVTPILPLPLFVLSNLIALTSCHFSDHDLSLSLLRPCLPSASSISESASYWDRLHGYLVSSQASNRGQGQSGSKPSASSRGDEVMLLGTLQLLSSIARFQSGRFARLLVEGIAWNTKSMLRLSSLKRKSGKGKSTTSGSKAIATFERPDIRLSFAQLLLAILHPSSVVVFDGPKADRSVDSGASASTKMLLLDSEHALQHFTVLLKGLQDDPSSVATHILTVTRRALLQDSKVSRGTLVALTRSSDLLSLLARLGSREEEIKRLSVAMLDDLCAKPGSGISFADEGWYGRSLTNTRTQIENHPELSSYREDETASSASRPQTSSGIYNPLISNFIQGEGFSPLYNIDHRDLLINILQSNKELQPIYLNSGRDALAGSRLEPPSTESGAKLSGLLAYQLLAQVLDTDLPRLQPMRPLSNTKAAAGIFPAGLPSAFITRALRHKDRLLKWSMFGLLQALLRRVCRFLDRCEHLRALEEDWNRARKSIVKETQKRLPDLATILAVLEDSRPAQADHGNSTPDYILIEAALRTASLYIAAVRTDTGYDLNPEYDFRKLLFTHFMRSSLDTEDDSATRINTQLHILRLIRETSPSVSSLTSATDSDGRSAFALLTSIATNNATPVEVAREALSLVARALEGAGAAAGDLAASSSLLFEGDAEEGDAWLEALQICSRNDMSSSTFTSDTIVALIEECLSRCQKNAYRYLELARQATSVSTDGLGSLSISPLLATLHEQLTIKIEKRLIPQDSQPKLMRYFAILVILLTGRGRVGVEAALASMVSSLSVAIESNSSAESTSVLSAASYLLGLLMHQKSNARPRQTSDESSADTLSQLLHPPQYVSHAQSMAPWTVLVHFLDSNSWDESKFGRSLESLRPESLPFKMLSLRIAAECLAQNSGMSPARLSIVFQLLKHSIAENSTTQDRERLAELFFAQEKVLRLVTHVSLREPLIDLALDSVSVTDAVRGRDIMRPFVTAILFVCRDEELDRGYSALLSKLLPLMDLAEAYKLLDMALSSIQKNSTSHLLSQLQLLRDAMVAFPELVETIPFGRVAQLLIIPSQHAGEKNVAAAVVALVSGALRQEQGLTGRSIKGSGLRDLPKRSLQWLADGHDRRGDRLCALLIERFDVLSAGLLTLGDGCLESRPESVRAAFDVLISSTIAANEETPAVMKLLEWSSEISRALFSASDKSQGLIADAWLLRFSLLQQVNNSNQQESMLSSFEKTIPELPKAAFRIAPLRVATALTCLALNDYETQAIVKNIVGSLLDKGLLWLVRRFAEDDEDDSSLVQTMDVFATLVECAAQNHLGLPKPHLADPVIEAGLKRRLSDRRQIEFVKVLVAHTDLSSKSASGHLASLLNHKSWEATTRVDYSGEEAMESVGRPILISIAFFLASKHPSGCLHSPQLYTLVSAYGGTLSLSDRLLYSLFEQSESAKEHRSLSAIARQWAADSQMPSSSAPTALSGLLTLNPTRAFNTCSAFPVTRSFQHLETGLFSSLSAGVEADRIDALSREMYDPLWILSLLAAALSDDEQITGLQWLSIARTNALGVLVCALSSGVPSVRILAWSVLAAVYGRIQMSDIQEREHILLALDAIRSAIPEDNDEVDGGRLPLTTTLFLAHQLRFICALPSSVFYPIFSRFLLQRPTFDTGDVPMLYNLLQSADPDHWRAHRLWILRFLRDCLRAGSNSTFSGRSGSEWRTMRRRYVWELLASMYKSTNMVSDQTNDMTGAEIGGRQSHQRSSVPNATTIRQTRALIEEIMLYAVANPQVAIELVTKKSLLMWIHQQLTREPGGTSSQGSSFSLSLLHRTLDSCLEQGSEKLERSSSNWLAASLSVLDQTISGNRLSASDAAHAAAVLHLLSQYISRCSVEDADWLINARIVPLLERMVQQIEESPEVGIRQAPDIKATGPATSDQLLEAVLLLRSCMVGAQTGLRLATLFTSLFKIQGFSSCDAEAQVDYETVVRREELRRWKLEEMQAGRD